jgi:hypothetical protein
MPPLAHPTPAEVTPLLLDTDGDDPRHPGDDLNTDDLIAECERLAGDMDAMNEMSGSMIGHD